MQEIDVAIIGAGPAGSAAAIALARGGYWVALFDKQPFPREKLCGDFVNPINLPLLRRLGVVDEIRAHERATVTRFRITSISGAEAEAFFPDGAIGFGMRRALLDQVLAEKAAESGATVRLGTRVDELSRSETGWRFAAAGESWQAKFLIGADGRNSRVAERLGLSSGAARRGRSVGFQTRLKWPGAAQDKIEIHLFPGGYAGLVALGGGEANLCLALDRCMLPRQNASEFFLQRCLPQNRFLKGILERSTAVAPFRSAYPVYFPPRRCYTERALLAGDAARVSEPVTGEGIYFAMESGLIAAETIDEALAAGDPSAGFLRRYERRCERAFRGRMNLNAVLRFAVYRRALLSPVIRLFARKGRWLDALVGAVCVP